MADGAYADALRLLGRVVVATQPYADQLLVVGGMVPVLYRRVPGFARARLAPPGTTEVDMTVPRRLALADRPMIDLLHDADLTALEVVGRAAAEAVEWRRWLARAGRDLRALFAAPTADGPVHGARIFRDIMPGGAPSEREIQLLVTRFTEQVFPA